MGRNAQAIDGASPLQHYEYTVIVGRVAKGNIHATRQFLHDP